MIRDPSDGSVKEVPKPNSVSDKTNSVSGLPFSSTKPENVKRLEKSREWLKNYRLVTTTSTESSTVTTGDQRAEDEAK